MKKPRIKKDETDQVSEKQPVFMIRTIRVLRGSKRRGLAPVELVLVLPIWMLIASAMVIVGNLGAWKIRGHLAVREAAARMQWPRTRAGDANPSEWSKPSAGLQSIPASPVSSDDPLKDQPVVRGPQLPSPPNVSAIAVDQRIMDPRSSTTAGNAFLNEPPPLWPRSRVRMTFYRDYSILDGNCGIWSARQSGELRSPVVWMLPAIQ